MRRRLRTFADRALERVRALPGVSAAGVSSSLPFSGVYNDSVIIAEGYQMKKGESLVSPNAVSVSPGYFETMGIPVRRGRDFTDADRSDSAAVVIVDERLARRFWADRDPIGRRMYQPQSADSLEPGPDSRWLTIVGVVGDVKLTGLVDTDERAGTYYFPAAQSPIRSVAFALKAEATPDSLIAPVRREIAQIDPELPLYGVEPMARRLDQSLLDRRAPMLLAVSFGAVALLLSAIGIYGVLAYQVAQRTKEIGIRVALGSDAARIFALVLREGAAIVGLGLALGVAGAVAVKRALETQLYGVSALDPRVLSVVVVLLAVVALAASIMPAWRAARIDPIRVLNEK
jgi:putative ABC transport system permease protein